MAVCPKLTELTPNTVIITKQLLTELIVSDFSRAVGTKVTVECRDGYFLHGSSTVTCQPNRKWSGNPYCSSVNPSEVVVTSTSNMDKDELAIIIGSSVASLIVLALIIFVIAILCMGRRREKKITRYRETEPYREDRSHGAYSISGKKPMNEQMQMYNMYSHLPTPQPGLASTPHQHQTPSLDCKQCSHIEDWVTGRGMCPHCVHCHDQAILRRETQHCSHCYVQEPPRRETHHCVYCHEKATFRREAHHCKHCCEAMSREFYRVHQRESPEAYQQSNTRQFDAIVPLSSGNDAAVHREVLSQSDEDDNSDIDRRRNGYIWRSMHDTGWAIPRPVYE